LSGGIIHTYKGNINSSLTSMAAQWC